jgi:hypothetical protein
MPCDATKREDSSNVRETTRIVLAILVGCTIAVIPSILQPHLRAGTFPDLICELVLTPGKLFATPFHDRGTASAEFLWRSRLATAVLFSGLAYLILLRIKFSN